MKWLFLIPALFAAIVIGVTLYLQPNDFIGCSDIPAAETGRCGKADAIIVVSGGNTNARTDAGIELFQKDWAGILIFSGAAQDKSGPSNAAAMKMRALAADVPESAILLDEESETTKQNATNSQSLFDRYNLESVILVTSGYHQRRASLEFKQNTTDTTILNYPVIFDSDWSLWWWMTPRGWWLAGGEVVKIIAFYVQGTEQ